MIDVRFTVSQNIKTIVQLLLRPPSINDGKTMQDEKHKKCKYEGNFFKP